MSANAASTTTSKIIKFEDGVPITVVLDGKRGVAGEPKSTKWGEEEWMHWCNGDTNIIYLPAAAQKQLELSGAQFRDWVSIEKVRGGKNQIWRVSVEHPHSDRCELGLANALRQREQREVSPIRAKLTGTETAADRALSQNIALAQHIAQGGYDSVTRIPANPSREDGTLQMPAPPKAAATAANIQIPIEPAAVLMDMSRPEARAIASALMQSIDAFAVAQAYATQKNLRVSFTNEDVRAFAISAFIGSQKGGR